MSNSEDVPPPLLDHLQAASSSLTLPPVSVPVSPKPQHPTPHRPKQNFVPVAP